MSYQARESRSPGPETQPGIQRQRHDNSHQTPIIDAAAILRLQQFIGNRVVAATLLPGPDVDESVTNTGANRAAPSGQRRAESPLWPTTEGRAVQRQPAASYAHGAHAAVQRSSKPPAKSTPLTLPTVTVKGSRTRKDIIADIRVLKGQLGTPPTTRTELKLIATQLPGLREALLKAPIAPPPKKDFISGPIHFTGTQQYFWKDEVNPNFYSFQYASLSDKAFAATAVELYTLALGPWGIVLSLSLAILSEPDTDRSFDSSGDEKENNGPATDFAAGQGAQTPSYFLEYGVGKPLKRYGEKFLTNEALSIGKAASRLATVLDVALAAYTIYQANTAGPSLHAAAVETTARIMGRAFNMARGINMHRGQGGEFIQHGLNSEVRVACNPLDRTPLPSMKDRRLAYDMVSNGVYEMMTTVLTPNHLKSHEAFVAFRNARIASAGAIVDNAGASIVEDSAKHGGTMTLIKLTKAGHAYKVDTASVR